MTTATIPQAVGKGCRKARVIVMGEADEMFSLPSLFSECIDAANRASRQFHHAYPGWKLYCRVVRGEYRFDRDLSAWAIRMARLYTRSRKVNGHCVVAPRGRRNDWIAAAGIDALLFVIYGRFPFSYKERAEKHGVDDETYKRVTEDLGKCMLDGFECYRSELHYAFTQVMRENAKIK